MSYQGDNASASYERGKSFDEPEVEVVTKNGQMLRGNAPAAGRRSRVSLSWVHSFEGLVSLRHLVGDARRICSFRKGSRAGWSTKAASPCTAPTAATEMTATAGPP